MPQPNHEGKGAAPNGRSRAHGSTAAARTVWDWRASPAAARPSAAPVRKKALVQAIIGVIVGGLFFAFGKTTFATVVWSITGLVLLTALVSPLGAYAALTRFFERVGEWIGRILTWVLLVPVFFLFFTIFGGLFRRGSRDKMERVLERAGATYWKKRDREVPELADYERQF